MTTIATLKKGQKALIKQFLEGEPSSRLTEFGLLPGQSVELIRKAPFNGPVLLEILGSQVAIRMKDARCIEVELMEQK